MAIQYDTDKYMIMREVADYLDVTTMTIHRWEKQGIFPPRVQVAGSFGNATYYNRTDIEAFKERKGDWANG